MVRYIQQVWRAMSLYIKALDDLDTLMHEGRY
jgi:hypothetical protein